MPGWKFDDKDRFRDPPIMIPQEAPARNHVHIRVAEVCRAPHQFNPFKASGLDRIHARVLKECSAELARSPPPPPHLIKRSAAVMGRVSNQHSGSLHTLSR